MGESLHEAKCRLSQKYLGRGKIHGVGLREDQNAIRVYVARDGSGEQEKLLSDLAADAEPFRVLTVESEPPRI